MKSKLYRILTENVNRLDIERLVDSVFDSYTIFEASGRWESIPEPSLAIDIVASKYEADLVRSTAKAIKLVNHQQAVLVLTLDVDSELI